MHFLQRGRSFSPGPEMFPADQNSFSFFCPTKHILGNAPSFGLLGSTNGTRAMQHNPPPAHKQPPSTQRRHLKSNTCFSDCCNEQSIICKTNLPSKFCLLHTQNRTLGNSAKIEVPSLCSELSKSNWPVNERSFSSDFHLRKKWQLKPQCTEKKMKKIFFHESKSSYGRKKYFPSLVAI